MTKKGSLEMMVTRVGNSVIKMVGKTLYTPFMAAAFNAVSHRLSLVDFVIDVRDARIPLSSECELLRKLSASSSSRRIIVLNKMDLSSHSHVKEWIRHFERRNFPAFSVNSHNKASIQEFLNFLQGQVRTLRKAEPERHTITMMLVGIPNVGKSALANSLHQIGRISAAEKGKLRHTVVSPLPGETKGIGSLKVASHPSIYVLDTPSILPLQTSDVDVCAKLALTGALRDSLAGEKALAQYFLAVLNVNDEYKKWEKLSTAQLPVRISSEEVPTDHTQDSVVLSVRRSLFEAVSSFTGNLQDEEDLLRLIQAEFLNLRSVFNLPKGSEEVTDHTIAVKLLNLFRTGRLGHYILDSSPDICKM